MSKKVDIYSPFLGKFDIRNSKMNRIITQKMKHTRNHGFLIMPHLLNIADFQYFFDNFVTILFISIFQYHKRRSIIGNASTFMPKIQTRINYKPKWNHKFISFSISTASSFLKFLKIMVKIIKKCLEKFKLFYEFLFFLFW